MAAHQAPTSLGFSRQEYWSGLPFSSPMHESEKWKWSRSVMSNSVISWTAAYQAPLSMGFSRQEYWSGVPLPSLLGGAMRGKRLFHPLRINHFKDRWSSRGLEHLVKAFGMLKNRVLLKTLHKPCCSLYHCTSTVHYNFCVLVCLHHYIGNCFMLCL